MKSPILWVKLPIAVCIFLTSLSLPLATQGQQAGAEKNTEQSVVTAKKCEVRIDQFKSKCDSQIQLLDNRQISVLIVTVESIPETHEISFYTEHVGMLVISVDGQIMVVAGRCKNSARYLRCSSDNKKAVLKITW